MALTTEEKAYIHESAREVSGAIIKDVIEAHISSCPHGAVVTKAKWVIIGLGLGASSAAGGGLVTGLLALLGK